MALIVVGGWYEVAWMYSCLFVGFMWVRRILVWSNLSPLYRVISRNVSSVSLNSYVNLIVLWIWLIFVIYVMNSDLDPVQMTKISSMNRFHISMFGLPISFSSISNFPINRFAYAGAIFVPIAVPWVCR